MAYSEESGWNSPRRRDFELLAERLLKGTKIQTAAMKYGLEDEVAQFYAKHFNRDVVKVGFVINPSVPHLGCSPDRRVYDPSENSPWGLFEIKCSMKEELKDVEYLQKILQLGLIPLEGVINIIIIRSLAVWGSLVRGGLSILFSVRKSFITKEFTRILSYSQ